MERLERPGQLEIEPTQEGSKIALPELEGMTVRLAPDCASVHYRVSDEVVLRAFCDHPRCTRAWELACPVEMELGVWRAVANKGMVNSLGAHVRAHTARPAYRPLTGVRHPTRDGRAAAAGEAPPDGSKGRKRT